MNIFQENKQLKKDAETFQKFVHLVLGAGPALEKVPPGEHDFQELSNLLEKRDKEKQQLWKQLAAENEESQNELEECNFALKQEIEQLKASMASKNDQIESLKNVNEQLQIYKAEALIKEIQANKQKFTQSNSFELQMRQSELTDQILKLKEECEAQSKTIASLERDNVSLRNQLQDAIQKAQLQSENDELVKSFKNIQFHKKKFSSDDCAQGGKTSKKSISVNQSECSR